MYYSIDEVPLTISVRELSQILGISRNTAYEIVRSGEIRSVRALGQIRIPKDALIDYLNAA